MSRNINQISRCCSPRSYAIVDHDKLNQLLATNQSVPVAQVSVLKSSSNLFSSHTVLIDTEAAAKIKELVDSVEQVLKDPKFNDLARSKAVPLGSPIEIGAGSLIGYDFHVSEEGVKLIEINTNPGGAMLNLALSRAQVACYDEVHDLMPDKAKIDLFESNLLATFTKEWEFFEPQRPLKVVALVDESPHDQFLYPEFLLFQQLFIRNGLTCIIVDPRELMIKDSGLWVKDLQIDLVYNRLTDFYFDLDSSSVLRKAYEEKMALVTPNPASYALYSDKRNLALLSDRSFLESLDLSDSVLDVLERGIPNTEIVNSSDSARLWAHRNGLYFKPVNGFGARAVYRGDKMLVTTYLEG